MKNICSTLLKISSQVKAAIEKKKPLVALESTIISHGMPYPQNKECALSIEDKVRESGAVPATIAILDGKIQVGLEHNQIQRLAFEGTKASKVSRRDLSITLSRTTLGATTVSATMIAAHAAGIKVFVTGGIGGVHRGYNETMDVSADLEELSRTPVAVVSAGVKSILDIPRTLEYLETKGVPVITYGSSYFPAFFSASSGIKSPFSENSIEKIAQFILNQEKLGLKNGMIVAVPNDKPADGEMIEKAISLAIKEVEEKNIEGSKITPYLLSRINQMTQGKSLLSNIALVHNNAKVGSHIAKSLAQKSLASKEDKKINFHFQLKHESKTKGKKKMIAIGGCAIDEHFSPGSQGDFNLGQSCMAISRKTLGGVCRNIAETAGKLQTPSVLVTAIGDDNEGNMIKKLCQENWIDLHPIFKPDMYTARYLSIVQKNKVELIGLAQMEINNQLTFSNIYQSYFEKGEINPHDIVILDANIVEGDLEKVAKYCSELGCFVIFEGKGAKTKKVIQSGAYKYINILKMNKIEKSHLFEAIKKGKNYSEQSDEDWIAKNVGSSTNPAYQYSDIKCLITDGEKDLQLFEKKGSVKYVKVPATKMLQKTVGAGDTFTGAFISMLLRGESSDFAISCGMAASRITVENSVQNADSVIPSKLNLSQVYKQVHKVV